VPVRVDAGDTVDPSGVQLGRQLVAEGRVKGGATLVFVNIHDDLARPDANFVTIQRL
jgi:hypothetical protein